MTQTMLKGWMGMVLAVLVAVDLAAQAGPSGPMAEAQPGTAAEVPGRGPQVGGAAPDFTLVGADGKTYKLSDYKDKVVVLEWLNQDCPFSNYKTGAGPRSKALAEKCREAGVVWLGIDTTHYQTVEGEAKYIKENQIPYPILMDTDGRVGRLYGAATTPHVFVIDKGKIRYIGAFDNDPRRDRPAGEYRGYVEEALAAVLAGKDVPLTSVAPWGCTVKYRPEDKG